MFAARDHFGIKPFYYYLDHKKFVFASEIKSIIAVEDINPAVDPKSLLHYLTLQYVPQPATMFRGVSKLEPGHFLKIDSRGRITKQRYWEPSFEAEDRPLETFIEEIRYSLRNSVKLHTQSDVP